MGSVLRYKRDDYEMVFYGKSSAAMYKDGKEVFHTGTRPRGVRIESYTIHAISFYESLVPAFDDIYNDPEE